MDFGVLGPLQVRRAGTSVRVGSRMQRRLLALLIGHDGGPVRSEQVIDVLWGGDPPDSAPNGLHTYVSRLRRVLGDGARIESDEHGYRLCLDEHDVDARRFEGLVAAAREHLAADEPADAVACFADALALWRGPAYAEFADEGFAQAEAARLDELRRAATEDAFDARLAVGDGGLVADLEAFVAANPLRERPHAQLMTALGRAGRQTDALEVFQRVRNRLASEVGLDPSPALQRLQADILRQASGVVLSAADASEPGERGGHAPSPGNLPLPVTSFLGRRHETEAVCRLLERGHLVTLTGVGGVGKTRLALQAAADASGLFPDGVWWCELAPADRDAVGHAVAAVLGIQQQANRSIADSIVGALTGKRLLLVLDNCEHVVEVSARLVGRILRHCPEVTILSTSREPLAVDGEQVWTVPPLPLPSDRGGVDDDAPSTQLFYDRARAFRADFVVDDVTSAAVADICRQLDGLPLAIELAAALVPAIEPTQIARRLGHRFRLLTHGPRTDPRHRTLAAVVGWSYHLLEPTEQRLFDRLAVFTGGFTLAAAEGVCADEDLPAERIAGVLAGLVSRSMVGVDRHVAPARYEVLETLRQYAAGQLSERGEEPALRARHATWFVDLAERADAGVRGSDEAPAVALLEAELANLRTAQRWAVDHDDADLALRLAAALYVFAIYRLRDEVFVWAEQAAGLASAGGHHLQSTVWGIAAHGISNRGELTRTRELAERALAGGAGSADADPFAAWHALSATALYEGELVECRRHTEHALEAARRQGDAYHLVMAPIHEVLALVYGQQREAGLEAALVHRRAADALGNPNQRAWALYGHAEACGDDDPGTALELLEAAVELAGPIQGRFLQGVARVASTSLRARHQSPRDALSAFPELIGHWRRGGDWIHQWTTLRNLVPLLVRLDVNDTAALLFGAQRVAVTAAPTYGDDATRLAGACETLASRLGDDRFATLVAQGEELGGEDAVGLALASIAEVLDTDIEDAKERPAGRPQLGSR